MPNNEYRLRRVLEVVQQTERPISEADLDRSAPLDYDFRCFFLVRPRTQLYDRIGLRCEQMLLGGLLQVKHSYWSRIQHWGRVVSFVRLFGCISQLATQPLTVVQMLLLTL